MTTPSSGGPPAAATLRAVTPTPSVGNAQAEVDCYSAIHIFSGTGPTASCRSTSTIPGQYDAMGVTLLGVPVVMIGFNASLAWTHTVSSDVRVLSTN